MNYKTVTGDLYLSLREIFHIENQKGAPIAVSRILVLNLHIINHL